MTATVATLETTVATLEADVNNLYVLISACMVLFMHAGFGMLEVGGVQAKNSKNILLKNILNACFSGLSWYIIGFTLANGPVNHDNFLGFSENNSNYVAMADLPHGTDYINWFFGFAFAATASTIVSGALAERTQFRAYFMFSMFLTAWIYPVVAYWCWNPHGWLKLAGDDKASEGFLDFAGSGVVHMVGGACAIVGAYFVGPRKYLDTEQPGVYVARFETGEDGELIVNDPLHNKSNPALSTVGTMILWFGWFGFNGGSQFGITGANLNVVAQVVVNTTLAPAAAVMTFTCFTLIKKEYVEVGDVLNVTLGGLVAITANCNVVEPWAALIIGSVAAFVYHYSAKLLQRFKIDDVINASPVHFFCGVWGLIGTGLFAKPSLGGMPDHVDGLFYGGGKLLGWQILGVFIITLWAVFWSVIFFGVLSYCDYLRVGSQSEKVGLDHYNEISKDEHCPDFGKGPNTPQTIARPEPPTPPEPAEDDVENPMAQAKPVEIVDKLSKEVPSTSEELMVETEVQM